jgi:hypothetical protein
MYEYPNVTATVKVAWKNTGITQGLVVLGGFDGEACYEGTLTRGHTGRFRVARRRELLIDRTLDPMGEYVESFYLLQRECVEAMLGKRSSVTQTAAEHLRSIECTFAAYESARRGEIIDLCPE